MKEEFFDGFKWALPKAFSDALSKCLFNVGDVIYDNPKAYSINWGEVKNILKHSIQVKSISASITEEDEKNNESVFSDNWDSKITFDFFSFPSMVKNEITTTQGALYSFLWKGEKDFIFNKIISFGKPILQKAIFKNLTDYVPELENISSSDCDYLFIYPVNIANQFYNEKSLKIINSFKNKSEVISYSIKFYSPSEIEHNLSSNICPTIRFNVFEIIGNIETINEALKNALYVPSKNKKSDKEYFRLKSHGALIKK